MTGRPLFCPTCGGFGGHGTWTRVRKGGIARLKARGGWAGRRRWLDNPDGSLRVYWPQRRGRSTIAVCPDPWHRQTVTQQRPAETSTTINLHAEPSEMNDRRHRRARRHRDRQSKARR